ncbi:peptidoglycan synthetase [Bacteroidia bacterium]|nr:peptidoglycan synthetase [Bacteroidia bacterium]
MKVHFIAIGGSAMHNLALALHSKGYTVSGSDDEIFEPARSRLAAQGLLPAQTGWEPTKITTDVDAIVLGMHARKDNPELVRAQNLGLKIYSYPEYLFEQTKHKTRIVVGGSHGKTTVTSMIMHALRSAGIAFDYMVGAQLAGFDTMVSLQENTKIAVFEGDEYLTSPIDPRPKFHLYRPHIGIITGIAWDHINVFPTWDNYVEQFLTFANLIEPQGTLIYCAQDKTAASVALLAQDGISKKAYAEHPHVQIDGKCLLSTDAGNVPIPVFGSHNLQNISAALLACQEVGLSAAQFYAAMQTFAGAARRLQCIAGTNGTCVYYDFAHSPSKLKATTQAVKQQFPTQQLVACMELHTFSSLNKTFLPHYLDTMAAADEALVYFNPHTLQHKQLEEITPQEVQAAFGGNVQVFTDSTAMVQALQAYPHRNTNFLLMSSGNFDGVDIPALAQNLLRN